MNISSSQNQSLALTIMNQPLAEEVERDKIKLRGPILVLEGVYPPFTERFERSMIEFWVDKEIGYFEPSNLTRVDPSKDKLYFYRTREYMYTLEVKEINSDAYVIEKKVEPVSFTTLDEEVNSAVQKALINYKDVCGCFDPYSIIRTGEYQYQYVGDNYEYHFFLNRRWLRADQRMEAELESKKAYIIPNEKIKNKNYK